MYLCLVNERKWNGCAKLGGIGRVIGGNTLEMTCIEPTNIIAMGLFRRGQGDGAHS